MALYKNSFLVIFIVALTCQLHAQGSEVPVFAKDVPVAVAAAAHQMFPNEKSFKWSKVNKDFIAEFGVDGHGTATTFESNGAWKETETEINDAELPVKVKNALDSKYKGNKIESAVRTTSPKEKIYEVTIRWSGKSQYVILSENGDFLED